MMSEIFCNDGVCDVNDKLQNVRIGAAVSICANCGKEGDEINNICNKCKQVRYCNAICKKVHKKKHKKDCEEHLRLAVKRAAELHDLELFDEFFQIVMKVQNSFSLYSVL